MPLENPRWTISLCQCTQSRVTIHVPSTSIHDCLVGGRWKQQHVFNHLLDCIESGCEGWAWINGPYRPSHTSIFGYSPEVGDYGHIFMAATGMGIVAQLPYIKELLDGQRQGQV
ncbi:hypothetical protein GB937_001741 [Aspergillus fischeri]|nr:hypothetical protein GB937_001741 [Aspergillus fischeri]